MKTRNQKLTALLLALLTVLLAACGKQEAPPAADPPAPVQDEQPAAGAAVPDGDVDGELIVDHEEELQYAQFFTMTHYKGGYKSFTVVGGQEDYEWLIVPEGKSVPEDLADNMVVLQQPIDRLRCSSSALTMIGAFGGLDHVSSSNTKADAIDAEIENVVQAMNEGKIAYSGSYKEPDYEAITAQGTQLVFDSSMLDSYPEVKEKYEELGIPFVVIRDSKEVHPLGSAEWIKIYGAVVGMWDEANAYFDAQVEKVNAVTTDEDLGKTAAIVYFSTDGTKVYAARDRISQFGFDNAGIIADMNTILKDSTVESTTYFSKMK